MKIKVCGIKEPENCLAVDKLGTDMLGMIFYDKSPRFINETILPETKAAKVGVFVNAGFADILANVKKHHLSYVQLHGKEPVELSRKLQANGIKVIKCFSIENEINNNEMTGWESFCSYFLFDTKSEKLGGSGKQFDWNLLENYQLRTPFLLSGGIGLSDLSRIKMIHHPAFAGVDINSKFELEPGKKNIDQVKLFIDEIKK